MDSKVLEKIQKLLALAESDNEAEAKNAMLKAQKLLAKNNLTLEEVSSANFSEPEIVVMNGIHKWNAKFRIPLAKILAENFRCETFLSNNQICFFGHADDCRICREVFNSAYSFIYSRGNKVYNEVKKRGGETKGVFNSYAMGFLYGLDNALKIQAKALMIITPEDVTEKFTKLSRNFKTKRSNGLNGTDYSAYNKGRADGENFTGNKQIEEVC